MSIAGWFLRRSINAACAAARARAGTRGGSTTGEMRATGRSWLVTMYDVPSRTPRRMCEKLRFASVAEMVSSKAVSSSSDST